MSRSIPVLAFLCAIAVAACGPLHHMGPPDAVIVFNNQSIEQADVYAVRSGSDRYRIGTVLAGRKESLRIPSSLTIGASGVSIVARLLGSSRMPTTGTLTLISGDTIEVTLPSDLTLLTVLPVRQP